MIVTIDGAAASGKSSVCKCLAKKLDFISVHTGNAYRVVCYHVLANSISPDDTRGICHYADNMSFTIKNNTVIVDEFIENAELHNDKIDNAISEIAAVPELRKIINQKFREICQNAHYIVEGRDAGINIFPNAELKFFLQASLEERARRRQQQHYSEHSLDVLMKKIDARDNLDAAKTEGILSIQKNMQVIYTNDLTIDQVCITLSGVMLSHMLGKR